MTQQDIDQSAAVEATTSEKTCGCGPDCTCGPDCACGVNRKCAPACTCAD